MKVLFVYPDFHVRKNPNGHVSYEPAGWYNEGLASLSAVLKQHGHETALYHLLLPPSKSDFQAEVRRQDPNLVGLLLGSAVFRTAANLALWVKELGYPTIAGSYHPTLAPEESIAAPGVDIVCLGEGEVALPELCDRMAAGRDPYDIPSLWFKRGGDIIRNPVGPLVENLDDLPIPDFALFDYAKLTSTQTYTALASFSRGCPYNCTYCCNHKLRSVYPNRKRWLRSRSPQNAIAYIHRLTDCYPQARYLRVMDDIFHWDEDWLEEFADLYRAHFRMPMAVNHRPNVFSERSAGLLREIGCYQIYFGVESGNDFVQKDVLHRHISQAQVEQAFKLAREAGMSTVAYNMVGLPFENMERALDTIKLNSRISAQRILNPVFCPYPNTDLYTMAVKEGFCQPKVDYEDDVICSMPNYGPDKIAFVCATFKLFAALYKAAYRLPALPRTSAERLIDRVFLSPWLPYRLLTRLTTGGQQVSARGKELIRQHMPGAYIFVRNRRLGNRL